MVLSNENTRFVDYSNNDQLRRLLGLIIICNSKWSLHGNKVRGVEDHQHRHVTASAPSRASRQTLTFRNNETSNKASKTQQPSSQGEQLRNAAWMFHPTLIKTERLQYLWFIYRETAQEWQILGFWSISSNCLQSNTTNESGISLWC